MTGKQSGGGARVEVANTRDCSGVFFVVEENPGWIFFPLGKASASVSGALWFGKERFPVPGRRCYLLAQ